jgi:5-methylcytosine-specific restriction endonuclease McrA
MGRLSLAMTLPETISALRDIRTRSGYSRFEIAVKTLNRERVNPEREKRQRFAPGVYRRLFDKQKGYCPECGDHLFVPAKNNEVDHVDPNREDFNHATNLQLLHPDCNRRKSSKSIYEQSKHSGRPFTSIIGAASEDLD